MKTEGWPGRLMTQFISMVLLILLATQPVFAAGGGGAHHPLGLQWSDDIKSSMANHKPKLAHQKFSAAAIPSSADWTLNMPPVGDQGSQGSCVAWSMGYALRTYLYQVKTGWGVNTADHQFSPAYIYNQINGGADNGSSPYDAARLLESQGCATLAVMPYDDSDYKTQPGTAQKANAANYIIGDWDYLDNDTTAVKSALASGPVWSGVTVYWTSGWQSSGDVSLSQVSSGMSAAGGHGICLVGYDDNHITADGTGAFKFINSWGKSWGHSGYGWISYQYLQNYGKGAVVLYESSSPAGLDISSPAAGASYTVGQTLPINWTASGLEKVDIYLISLKPGISVAAGVAAADGGFSWNIPGNIEPGAYKIQINGVGNLMAVSEWFDITGCSSPTINVTRPSANTSIAVGQSLPISWTATGLEKVDIYLISLKPGVSVASSVSASTGTCSWTIPVSIEPGSYKIQINGQGSAAYGLSEWFTIQAPSGPEINISNPMAGASYSVGQSLPISWTASGLDKVDIYLISLQPGIPIAAGVVANAGNCSWNIPSSIVPGSYQVQINGQGTGIYTTTGWFNIKTGP
ncbi:MAG: Ser-Thr-rich GPI-anchored membrane family protein [Syntrophomonas sp.]